MLARNHPDRIRIAFDDHRLVANAGLLLPVTLAQHLGLREVVDSHVDLGDAPGRANPGDKLLTLVASALAGGDFIDDADVLRTGGTAGAIGCVVKAPSTLGTFLRSFRWGHVRQLDRVSRELLSRAWAAGAGPGEGPLTIDLDSTMCETYGLAKEGARHHGYTGQRGYHPLLAIAAGTGDVLMSRLREGRANTVRGAAHFLRETVGRVRHAGARGQLTVRADSGFYAHALVVVCREMDVRFSITIRQHARLRELIEAIPEEDWTPVPYWMDRGADVAETTYTPFQGEPEAAPVRLIVRRVKPTPGSQLALFASYSYHGFITDRDGETLELEADHRRHAEIENAIRDLKHGVGLNHLPSGRFPANGAWLAVQVLAHNLARWTARIGLDEGVVTTKTLPAALLLPGRTAHPLGPPPHFASATGLALGNPVHSRAGSIASPAIACLTAPTAPDTSTRLPNRPTESHRPGPRLSSPACCPADPAPAPLPRTAIGAPNDNQRPPPAPFSGIERGPSRPTALTPCSNPKAAPHRWIRAKAGYAPLVTGDPEEALRLVGDEEPDLVLLDMMLPGADGIELMKDILETAEVPVIFLSAYGQDQLVARALDMGAVDYFAKPFSPTELAARIRAALRKRASEASEPYVLRGLVVNYGERWVTLAGPSAPADGHRVPAARRAFCERRTGVDIRASAATGVGGEEQQQRSRYEVHR